MALENEVGQLIARPLEPLTLGWCAPPPITVRVLDFAGVYDLAGLDDGMASDDGGTTIGVWIGENDDVLAEFDETLDCGPGHVGSRSEAIKEAMRLAVAVRETVDDFPYEVEGAPLRHQVRQALVEQDRREAAMDG